MNPLIRLPVVSATLLACFVVHAWGAPTAASENLIVFSNGDQLHGHLEGMGPGYVLWRHEQVNDPIKFSSTRISRMELAPAATHSSAMRVLLATGESLPCNAVMLNDTEAELDTAYGGKFTFARTLVSRIEFTAVTDWDKTSPVDKDNPDRLALKNGDHVSGRLLEITEGKVKINSNAAGVIEIPLDRISGIALQPSVIAPEKSVKPPGTFLVRLVGGGLLELQLDRMKDGALHGRNPRLGDVHLKLDAVEAIGVLDADPQGWKTSASGLRYRIIKTGKPVHPRANDTVKVNYELHLKDGTQVDASAKHGGATEFPLNAVVKGFSEGTQLIGKGGKIELIVPPHLGYGDGATPQLPASSTLYFTVELVDFTVKRGND